MDYWRMTLRVIHVAPDAADWKGFLTALVTFMRRAKESQGAFYFDVCVLNALREPEVHAVHETWGATLEDEQLLNRSVLFRKGALNVGATTKQIICAHPSQMGPVAAGQPAEALLREFRPRMLIMTGICGGFSDHVRLGDVVVADKSWDWQAGKWTEKGTLLSANDQKEASSELVAVARGIEPMLKSFHDEFKGERPAD